MCLIIIAYQADPRYPLVVAANRDEFFTRPTAQADFWSKESTSQEMLAGKDLLAGGTWLGLNRSGRFAAVTNIRDPSQTESRPRSRGELTMDYLSSELTPQQYCDSLESRYSEFAGYNLLVGDRSSLVYVNNQEEKIWEVEPGIHGLSNGLLNSPWPKVNRGKQSLKMLLDREQELSTDALIEIMNDRTEAADADLPNTGVPVDLERKLSSAFIRNTERHYGTLCSSAIIFDDAGEIRFCEQNYDESGAKSECHFYQLLAGE